MLIKRKDALALQKAFEVLKGKTFDVNLQYKIIKLNKAIKEEQEIYEIQMNENCEQFFEKDEKGNVIINNNGGIKVKNESRLKCCQLIKVLNECSVQLPDIFFTLEELEELKLSLGQLALFEPFIKT